MRLDIAFVPYPLRLPIRYETPQVFFCKQLVLLNQAVDYAYMARNYGYIYVSLKAAFVFSLQPEILMA